MRDIYEPGFTILEEIEIKSTMRKKKEEIRELNEAYYKERKNEENKNLVKLKKLYEEMIDLINDYPEFFKKTSDSNEVLDELQEDITKKGCFDYEEFKIYLWGDNTLTFNIEDNSEIYIDYNILIRSHIKYIDDEEITRFNDFFEREDIQELFENSEKLISTFKYNHLKKGNTKRLSKIRQNKK